jgi:tetratricopeptide (TPR) repeat protein
LLLCGLGCNGPVETPPKALPLQTDSFQLAMDSINARIVKHPDRAALYDERARLFLDVDSLAAAQRDMERALRLDSNNVNLRLRLGDLYYKTVQVDKARDQFNRAAQLDPSNTSAILKQAEIQLVLRNYKESMNLVNDALRKDQHAAHGYFLKGWIHMETGDTTLALSSFRTAVEQNTQDYPAYIMLGKISAAKHDPLAEQYYSTAITLRPRSVEAWYDKGMYYQENGQDSAALDCYKQIMAIDARNALAWYNSGYIRMEHLHDLNGAEQDFSKAIELEPGYADAWYNRGLVMERKNELDSAAANYQIAIGLAPNHDLASEALDRLQSKGVRIKVREARKP